jgi:uncharacterized protein YjbI with pentapeptide repeats
VGGHWSVLRLISPSYLDSSFKSTLEVLLRGYTGCKIEVTDIQPGSIRITIQGDHQGIERLIGQFAAGRLTEVDGFPVKGIYFLSEELVEESEESNSLNKWDTIQEILRNPKNSSRLRNVDLSDADLSRAILNRADLSRANLFGADLSRAILLGADLRGAVLSRAVLSYANLSHANLLGAVLSYANLSYANLLGAVLSYANLSYANLLGANLNRTVLHGSIINEETKLDTKWHLIWRIVNEGISNTDLSGADLSYAYLSGTDLSHANLSYANLSGADLSHANLSSADLNNANLNHANVQNAQFGQGLGLSNKDRQSLAKRGAIFDDAPGDREDTYSPTRR